MAIQFKSDLAKPVGRLLVDWDNPLAPRAGFIATTEPGGVVTLHARQGITRKIITNVIASPGRVAHGYGAASVSSAIAAFTLPAIAVNGATNSLTHIHIGRLAAATTSHRVWEAYNGDSTSLISAVLYSANSFQYTALPAVGGTSAAWISAAVVSPLERSSFVCTHDGVRTNNPLMWVNGQSVAVTNTAPGSGTIQAYRSNDGFFLAQRQSPQDRGWTGNIEFLYLDFVQRDADDVLKIERNPWQLFTKPRRVLVPVSAGGDVSLALSGAAATSAAGNTSAGTSTALTGVSSTAATGTLATATSVALSGISSTSAAGTLAASISAALTGVSSTAAAGTLSAGGDASAAVTGQAASTAQGTLGVTVSGAAALSGASAAASAGTLSAGISTALTGASAAVSAGSLTAGGDVSVTIAGQAVSTAQGTVGVTATGAVTVALTGAAAVVAAGNIFVVAPAVGWTPVDDSDPNAWIPVDDSNAALWV